MTTTIAVLLQLAAALLTGAGHNDQMPLAVKQQIVIAASQTIQLSTQALAKIDFSVPQNAGIWPTISELNGAPYLDAAGNYVRLGQGVQLDDSSVSFGDINNDGLDDAVVVVKKNTPGGLAGYFLAAMLNQGGILFNIADAPLDGTVQIYSHQIQNGKLAIETAAGGQNRSVDQYMLLGNQLVKE